MVSRISTVSLAVEKENDRLREGTADFEQAIEICENGRYQYTLLVVCGVMFTCVGCQYGVNAYILPSAECDLNMGSEEKGLLNVAFLIGTVISALFWGVFAGAYGRRNILVMTLFGDSILTLIASFSQGFKLLLLFRVISGFLVGAPGSLVYMYLSEFHAERHRAKSICFLGFFFTLAWLILPGLAWIIIPLPLSFEFYGFQYNSWRIFLGALSLPTFAIAAITLTYPESPKFLVSQGKTGEALAILRRIYAANTGRDKSEFPVGASEGTPLRCRVQSGEKRGTVVSVGRADGSSEERLVAAAHHRVATPLEVRHSPVDNLLREHVRVLRLRSLAAGVVQPLRALSAVASERVGDCLRADTRHATVELHRPGGAVPPLAERRQHGVQAAHRRAGVHQFPDDQRGLPRRQYRLRLPGESRRPPNDASEHDADGRFRRPRHLLRPVVAADPHSGVRAVPGDRHGELRAHQRGGGRFPHARVRRGGLHDGLPR
ncbi:uncharacterized protein LOC105278835 isoform X2 [Ooceraea biroi]|uniref:uncharacterized protein LOC105278835 isoform X2 n=1 Tax=Ooceraea biroi TaxID=2015173 RepID=UPI0005BAEBE5|nr:uncharacterized protein LOC105278835 isoform X2 [Ooceraea biroi]